MRRAGKPSKQRSKAIKKKLHITVREGCYCSEWPGGTTRTDQLLDQIPACGFRKNDSKPPQLVRGSCPYKPLYTEIRLRGEKQKASASERAPSFAVKRSKWKNLNQLVLRCKPLGQTNLVFNKYCKGHYFLNIKHLGKKGNDSGARGVVVQVFLVGDFFYFLLPNILIVGTREKAFTGL